MKEKIITYIFILVTIIGILLSISFVYKDLTAEIKAIKEKSNNDVFYEDNKIFKEEISEMQSKLDNIQVSVKMIADQLEIDIIEITK
jgi:uncharacterized membrane protein SpoIIM required for sporulation